MSTEVKTQATDGTGTNSVNHAVPRYGTVKVLTPVAPTANNYAAFMYVPMPAQLWEKVPTAATMTITMDSVAGSRTLSLIRIAKPNTLFSQMTHDNKPGNLSGASAVSVTQTGTTTTWVFNVLPDILAIAGGGDYFGFKLTSASFATPWKMHSWQSKYPPKLTVVFADDADEPGGLRPDGIVALAKPVLTWTPVDGLVSARVQLDVVGGTFTSPTFDSGNVPTTVGQIDLAALTSPAFTAGIANNASVIARVLQTTDAGNSVWSDPITITRVSYGSLVITSPAAGTTDPTPTLAWTFAAQDRYQVTVTNAAGKVIADTGVIIGAATAYTPPVGALADGDTLTFRLRVWDTVDRTTSPGDVGYVEGTITTTYAPGTIAAASAFTAAQDGVRPWVNLTWARSAGVPDEWLIIRDGVTIARLDGTDGVNPILSYRDYTALPNKQAAYTVRPVVAGVTGNAITAINVTTVVTGVWLVDPDNGIHFSHSGHNQSPAYSENSVTYYPVGGDHGVKRTFALRGLEGSVGGSMEDFDGRTVEQQEADFMAIKGDTAGTFRHVAGNINVPVTVANLTSLINYEAPATRDVAYDISQNGELPFPVVVP